MITIEAFIRSLTLADVALVLLLAGAFVVGWVQGFIRQLLGIGAFAVALVLAANLRDQLGDFLSRNWTFFPRTFNLMVGFLSIWIVLGVTLNVAIQMFYKRIPIVSRFSWVDEILGGVFGLVVAVFALVSLVVVLDSFYKSGVSMGEHEVRWLRDLYTGLHGSAIVGFFRDNLIPGVVAVLGPLLPRDVQDLAG